MSIFIILLLATTPALFTMDCGEKLTVEKELTEEDGLYSRRNCSTYTINEGNIEDYSYNTPELIFLGSPGKGI